MIKVWDVKTGILLRTLTEMAVISLSGKSPTALYCTKGAEKYFQIVSEFQVLDRDKYWNQFYTPDLLAKVMSGK